MTKFKRIQIDHMERKHKGIRKRKVTQLTTSKKSRFSGSLEMKRFTCFIIAGHPEDELVAVQSPYDR